MKNLFKKLFPRRIVGIDIGTWAIKMVEISSWGKSKTLKNYSQVKSELVLKKPLGQKGENTTIPSDLAALAIREMLDEAKIKTKAVIFSVPDFSTFCTTFEIPLMPEKEVPGAILYNASRYLTLPISEVTLDWRIVSDIVSENASGIKVFVVAIPNQAVQEYKTIAKNAGLELYAIESEVFGITRALIKDDKKTICLVDIGVQSSTLNIIDRGLLKRSYSFNFNKEQLPENLVFEGQKLESLFEPLFTEIKNISNEFYQSEQKEIEELYLTGGRANLPGLKEYFTKSIGKQASIPNCFMGFSYPKILEDTLFDMSPSFSAATGVALNGLDI